MADANFAFKDYGRAVSAACGNLTVYAGGGRSIGAQGLRRASGSTGVCGGPEVNVVVAGRLIVVEFSPEPTRTAAVSHLGILVAVQLKD